jgi:hypothetical protein
MQAVPAGREHSRLIIAHSFGHVVSGAVPKFPGTRAIRDSCREIPFALGMAGIAIPRAGRFHALCGCNPHQRMFPMPPRALWT